MKRPRYDCNPDSVLSMQDLGVGVEDILQYCRAILSNRELQRLVQGLDEIVGRLEEGTIEEHTPARQEVERTV